MANTLVFLNNITTRIRNRFILENTSWKIRQGESWAVIGPNGSGKTSLTRVLSREFPVIRGNTTYGKGFLPERDIAYVSFESQKRLFVKESKKEEARYYSGHPLQFTRTKDILLVRLTEDQSVHPADVDEIVRLTGVEPLLNRDVTRLYTGEFRKVLIAQTLMEKPIFLVLDEPFKGLDSNSQKQINDLINQLALNGVTVIMVTHRIDSIPSEIKKIICLKENKVVAQGERKNLLNPEFLNKLYASRSIQLSKDSESDSCFHVREHIESDELVAWKMYR